MKFLSALLAERITDEFLVAVRTEIIAEVFVGRLGEIGIFLSIVLHLAEQLADGFHVVVIEIGFGNLGGVVSSEDLYLDHKALVLSGAEFLTAKITGDV
jgi:hypothetical protein